MCKPERVCDSDYLCRWKIIGLDLATESDGLFFVMKTDRVPFERVWAQNRRIDEFDAETAVFRVAVSFDLAVFNFVWSIEIVEFGFMLTKI
jgi:hypothetical protein